LVLLRLRKEVVIVWEKEIVIWEGFENDCPLKEDIAGVFVS
jgi:hypothetical protein